MRQIGGVGMMALVSGRVGGGRRAARARSARLGCATRKKRAGLALGHLFMANGRPPRPPRGVRAGGNVGGFAAIGRVPAWRRWSSRQTCRVSGACMSGSPTAVSAAPNGPTRAQSPGGPLRLAMGGGELSSRNRNLNPASSGQRPIHLRSDSGFTRETVSKRRADCRLLGTPRFLPLTRGCCGVGERVRNSECSVRGMQSCCCAREKISPTSLTRPPRPPPWRA